MNSRIRYGEAPFKEDNKIVEERADYSYQSKEVTRRNGMGWCVFEMKNRGKTWGYGSGVVDWRTDSGTFVQIKRNEWAWVDHVKYG